MKVNTNGMVTKQYHLNWKYTFSGIKDYILRSGQLTDKMAFFFVFWTM